MEISTDNIEDNNEARFNQLRVHVHSENNVPDNDVILRVGNYGMKDEFVWAFEKEPTKFHKQPETLYRQIRHSLPPSAQTRNAPVAITTIDLQEFETRILNLIHSTVYKAIQQSIVDTILSPMVKTPPLTEAWPASIPSAPLPCCRSFPRNSNPVQRYYLRIMTRFRIANPPCSSSDTIGKTEHQLVIKRNQETIFNTDLLAHNMRCLYLELESSHYNTTLWLVNRCSGLYDGNDYHANELLSSPERGRL